MQSIANFSRGDYCFIPNTSILGTVFNYTVINLKVIYAHDTIIILNYLKNLNLTKLKLYINKAAPKKVKSKAEGTYIEYSINLKII